MFQERSGVALCNEEMLSSSHTLETLNEIHEENNRSHLIFQKKPDNFEIKYLRI